MNPLKCFIYYVVKSIYENCRFPFSTYQTISPMIKRFLKLKKYSIRIKIKEFNFRINNFMESSNHHNQQIGYEFIPVTLSTIVVYD